MNTIGSKRLYKIFLSIIKFVPNILALIQIINLIQCYFGIPSFLLTCLGRTSIILLIILYLISFIFKFCGLYRLSLNYTTLVTLLTIIDYYIGIPIDNTLLYELYGAITGVFITVWVWFFYKNRNNPKIDYIKQLCERYNCLCK